MRGGDIVRVCHQIACADCVIHFATVPHSAHAPLSVCALRHMQIQSFFSFFFLSPAEGSDGLGPQSLPLHGSFCVFVGGGGGGGGVLRCAWVRVCMCVFVRVIVHVPGCSCPPTASVTIRSALLTPSSPFSHPQSQFVYSNFEG